MQRGPSTVRLDGRSGQGVAEAARVLRSGGTVALPTETVYGLGARGLDADAVAAIYRAKGRPADNPLILHVTDLEAALPLWRLDDRGAERVRRLGAAHWPGPLTVVAPRSDLVPDCVTAGLQRVAVRV
ncbi:MAG: L-threonylcarbamoyladenylate synthase, partial [Planctomycetes bacterium]|nr:L-threonylcarbamoyladenylate synthase [Planctomycetota bacterium]